MFRLIALASAVSVLTSGPERIRSTLHIPHPLPRVESELVSQFEPEPDIVADRVTYATEFGLRIPAIVYHPSGGGPRRPALIIVNGHGGDKYSWYATYAGVLYARAGAVVLTYDPIGEGERNIQHKSGTRAHDRYVPPDEMARRMSGLMVTDVMQAVSYLRGRKDVDPRRVAAAGYSMGSFVLALTCALDQRLKACVLVGGGDLDGPEGYWDTSNKKMCQSIPYRSLSFLGDRPAVLFTLHARRGATLIYNGDADEVVQIPSHGESFFRDLRSRAIELHGSDHNIFEYALAPGGGHRPYFLTRPVGEWMHRQLAFPAWKSIAGQETHISGWIRENQVAVDRLYADEHREGGTMALGRNIPPIVRERLNVLPETVWAAQKERFVLEEWLRRALREANGPPNAQ